MRTYARGYWPDAAEAAAAGGAAVHLQRAEDQLDAGADRRHRRRVLRHADRRHGLSHLDRGRPHEPRHGLGGDRGGGAGGLGCSTALLALVERAVTFWHPSFPSSDGRDARGENRETIDEDDCCSARRPLAGDSAGAGAQAADKVTLAAEMGDAGAVRRLLRRQGQGLLQGRRPRRDDQAGRPRHRPGAGDRRRRRRRRSSTGCRPRSPRARRACRWSTSRRSSSARAWC